MAKLTKEEFVKSLKEMTMLEIKDLVDALKEEFGVDPSAVATAATPAITEQVEAGPAKADIVLTAAGVNKIQVIKLIRDITGLGLKEAKDIADNGGVIKESLPIEEAKQIRTQLEEAGATIELK